MRVANATALAAALTVSGTVTAKAGHYVCPPLSTAQDVRIVCEPGVTLSFPALGPALAAITQVGNNLSIEGNPRIVGPAGGVYVAGECGIRVAGSPTSRKAGLTVEATISNFGSCGISGQFADDVRIWSRTSIRDCGYAGAMFSSCNGGYIAPGVRIGDIGPGTSGHCYGLSLTHESAGYDADPNAGTPAAVNAFCQGWTIGGLTVEDVAWTAIDTHGGYNIRIFGCAVYGAMHGIHLAGGSGDASAYGGWDNEISGCLVDSRKADGTPGGYANTGIGINVSVSGTPVAAHRRIAIRDCTIIGYGVVDNSGGTPALGAKNCTGLTIDNVVFESWGGVAVNISGSPDSDLRGLKFRDLADPADTIATCIINTSTDPHRQYISGCTVSENGGTAARLGFSSLSPTRAHLNGNDWAACTVAKWSLQEVNFFCGDDGTPYKFIDLGSSGANTTLDLSDVDSPFVEVGLTAGAATTVTNITGVSSGARIVLVVRPGSSPITVNRAVSALGGSAVWTGTPYHTLDLLNYATSGVVQWIETSRSANG